MITQEPRESRIEYLARVLYAFMEENYIAGACTIDYDEANCDGFCLAQDFLNELGLEGD